MFDDPESVILDILADPNLPQIQDHVLIVIGARVELFDDIEPMTAVGGQVIGQSDALPCQQTLRLHFLVKSLVEDVVRGLRERKKGGRASMSRPRGIGT